MRTTLNTALHMASHTECNGYEIDNFWPQPDGSTRLLCDDYVASVLGNEVEIPEELI